MGCMYLAFISSHARRVTEGDSGLCCVHLTSPRRVVFFFFFFFLINSLWLLIIQSSYRINIQFMTLSVQNSLEQTHKGLKFDAFHQYGTNQCGNFM